MTPLLRETVEGASSAKLFGAVFELVVKEFDPIRARQVAAEFWKKRREFDFHPSDMDCDSTLCLLGLARVEVQVEGPIKGSGETIIYKGIDF